MRPHKTISSCPRCRHKTTPHCISANSCNSWTKDFVEDECLEGTTERSDGNRGRSPREEAIALILPGRQYATGHVNKPLIALVTISATDPVAIQSIETIRVNPCNSWAKKITSGHKLTSSQFNQQIHFLPQQSSSTTPQNSPTDNQNQQHSSSAHNNTWQTSC